MIVNKKKHFLEAKEEQKNIVKVDAEDLSPERQIRKHN